MFILNSGQRYNIFAQNGILKCERNKKTLFIRKLMHKNAKDEHFLTTFAVEFEIF